MNVLTGAKRRWLFNPSRIRIRQYNARFARTVTPEMLVLDAGSGKAPYRDLFSHAHYETADFAKLKTSYYELTYVCDLTAIPVEDARFDRIVFNQVLEHVPDPLAVLRELARVTKDGGRILCSCPFFFHPHQRPYDFYRYTAYGLRKLFEDAGFRVQKLEWVEGYFATVGLQFQQMSTNLPRKLTGPGRGWRWWFAAPVVHAVRLSSVGLAGLFYRMDMRWKYTGKGYPKNYVVIAKRRSRASLVRAA
jgi:SAM-dependent methyltransferase